MRFHSAHRKRSGSSGSGDAKAITVSDRLLPRTGNEVPAGQSTSDPYGLGSTGDQRGHGRRLGTRRSG
jgi:hypothetical protein